MKKLRTGPDTSDWCAIACAIESAPIVSPPTLRGFVPARANSSMNAAPTSGIASAKQVVSLQSKM